MKAAIRRFFSPLAIIIVLSLIIASCAPAVQTTAPEPTKAPEQPTQVISPTEAPKPTEPPATQKKVTITFLMEGNYTDKGMAGIKDYFIDGFEAAHPNVKLEMNFVEKDIFSITRTALTSSDGPDLVFTTVALIVDLANAGLLNSLDKYADQYQWKDKLASWAYNSGQINGHLYTMPMGFETMYLYYNKTALDKNGWKPPTNLAEFEKLCTEMAAKKMSCIGSSNTEWKGVNEWWVSVLYNDYAGADKVAEALNKKRSWEDPLFLDSIKLFKGWMDKGWISENLKNYYSLTDNDVYADFCSGKTPMMVNGTWAFKNLPVFCDPVGAQWDFTTTPILREGVTSARVLAIPGVVGMNAQTKNPDEAAAVIDWLYSDTQRAAKITEAMDFGRWLMPLKYSPGDFNKDDDPRMLRFMQDFSDVNAKGMIGYTTWTFWPTQTDTYIIEELDGVLSGTLSPGDYVKKQQELYTKETTNGTLVIPPTKATSP